jgi:hypothetical protein
MLTLLFAVTLGTMPTSLPPDSLVLIDFAAPVEWLVVNDGVMGGVSSSSVRATDEGTGVFAGYLSLDNNGGFASIRADMSAMDLAPYTGVVLRVRGDGRRYQLRFRTDGRFDGLAYRAEFDTEADAWIDVTLPFDAFEPSFRGYVPPNAPPLDPGAIRQLGFLLGDKLEGEFRLEIQRVVAVTTPSRGPDGS